MWEKAVGPVRMEAELGMMLPQAQGPRAPPEAGRGFSSGAFRAHVTLPRPRCQTPGLQSYERVNFYCFQPPGLLLQPQETYTRRVKNRGHEHSRLTTECKLQNVTIRAGTVVGIGGFLGLVSGWDKNRTFPQRITNYKPTF